MIFSCSYSVDPYQRPYSVSLSPPLTMMGRFVFESKIFSMIFILIPPCQLTGCCGGVQKCELSRGKQNRDLCRLGGAWCRRLSKDDRDVDDGSGPWNPLPKPLPGCPGHAGQHRLLWLSRDLQTQPWRHPCRVRSCRCSGQPGWPDREAERLPCHWVCGV